MFGSTDLVTIVRRTSLTGLKQQGILPHDIAQCGVPIADLFERFTPSSLISFGFTFDHFLQMGLRSEHIQRFVDDDFRTLRLSAQDLVSRVGITPDDLVQLRLKAATLRELRFTAETFTQMGCRKQHLDHVMTQEELQTYFRPDGRQMVAMGYVSARPSRRSYSASAEKPVGTFNF